LVCGTSSSAGKSTVALGLCRSIARRGVRVAPFKALNMSNNAVVATDGGEIARAQFGQAIASGVAPVSAMNPILVKPLDDYRSQVIVRGRVHGAELPSDALGVAVDAFAEVQNAHDVVVAEGAGGAAEVNLLARDIANLPLARELGLPAILVADIDRGGMLAAVAGTVALLPKELRACLCGIVVNRFRGNIALLEPALAMLEARTRLPVLGVLPELETVSIDTEDSLDLDAIRHPVGVGSLDVAVVRFPHASNWSDIEPIAHDPSTAVRLVGSAAAIGVPDLVVLPGSRRVLADLQWLRERGLADAITKLARANTTVLGVCGGYQMLGRHVRDEGIEDTGDQRGLELLDVETVYDGEKLTRWVDACALGTRVRGFDMRHGRVSVGRDERWITGDDSACSHGVFGTNLHGLFEHDLFRRSFLEIVAARRHLRIDAPTIRFADLRAAAHDRIADAVDEHLASTLWT
jgi:adenosylcobyric acid synthase